MEDLDESQSGASSHEHDTGPAARGVLLHGGRPAGCLHEAFQELEKVLNTKYKTTSANRIIVAPCRLHGPISGADGRRLWRYRGGKHFDHGSKEIADFTIPTVTGMKIIAVTGPGAPELKSVEDLSGKKCG
jgi:hypothetical protein